MQGFSMDESDFADCNLLETIDFDDIFIGIDDGDSLPDLEMDNEILAEFSGSESETKMEINENTTSTTGGGVAVSDVVLESPGLIPGHEIACKAVEPKPEPVVKNPVKSKKSSSGRCKNPPPVKKKAKVDWTPELHRRFVEAVEQLGIDKAVPSRILEIMGTDCLTRHNIASHLQKYRSHRKHIQAREAEAASWSRRRQMYGTAAAAAAPEVHPWVAPTMGFPPVTPAVRPLHVWGHPSVDQSIMYTWPKHVAPPPPHAWPPPPQFVDPSFWHNTHHQYVPPPPGRLYFPTQFPSTRFPPPPPSAGVPAAQTLPKPPSDVHPSKESIDAAIGDVITKPWLPLPLGLKPPSINSVMVELQRQGVSKIPPT